MLPQGDSWSRLVSPDQGQHWVAQPLLRLPPTLLEGTDRNDLSAPVLWPGSLGLPQRHPRGSPGSERHPRDLKSVAAALATFLGPTSPSQPTAAPAERWERMFLTCVESQEKPGQHPCPCACGRHHLKATLRCATPSTAVPQVKQTHPRTFRPAAVTRGHPPSPCWWGQGSHLQLPIRDCSLPHSTSHSRQLWEAGESRSRSFHTTTNGSQTVHCI